MPHQRLLESKAYLPNGGWGWMVVLGGALTNVFNQSLVSVFGLLYADHIEILGGGTAGAATIMNLCGVCLNLSGLLTGPLLKSRSTRFVNITGSLLTSLGLVTSAFSTQMWHLVFYAIFVGFGLGLIQSATFMAVNSYFSTKRGTAVGLSMAGTGLGQMLMPNLVGFLLGTYSFRVTTLTIGGLALHGVIGGLLFRPVKQSMIRRNSDDLNDDELTRLLKEEEVLKPLSLFEHIKKVLELDLLKHWEFSSLIVGLALAYTASINFSLLFPYYLQNTAKLSRADTAFCMSILAAADLLSRLTFPTITDRLKVRCKSTFIFGTVLLIIVRTILALTTKRSSLIVISAVYGFIRAMTVVNQNLTISEYCRLNNCDPKLASALGLNMMAKGICVITVGQLLGWIRDATQSYSICLHAQNVCLVAVLVLWTAEKWIRKPKQLKTENSNDNGMEN